MLSDTFEHQAHTLCLSDTKTSPAPLGKLFLWFPTITVKHLHLVYLTSPLGHQLAL